MVQDKHSSTDINDDDGVAVLVMVSCKLWSRNINDMVKHECPNQQLQIMLSLISVKQIKM